MGEDPLDVILEYHERTKHHFDRYARSLGYLDWETQPDPFRRFEGAPRFPLDEPPLRERPTYDELFQKGAVDMHPAGRSMIGRLFYHSLALSAWKQAPGSGKWSLRINPSSGALHPTEGYLIAGPIEDLCPEAAVYHYAPFRHELERRVLLREDEWQALAGPLPAGSVLVALTSIHWRESWKYGERAFRYCQHDAGHAIAALAVSAASLGWGCRLIDTVACDELSLLLGLHLQDGAEREHADCLLAICPASENRKGNASLRWPSGLGERLRTAQFAGSPNRLSRDHHPWPVIEEAAVAARFAPGHATEAQTIPPAALPGRAETPLTPLPERGLSAERIIRQRRSAVDMDGKTGVDRETFYRIMARLMPAAAEASNPPAGCAFTFDVLPWPAHVSLALFVHRVDRLAPGLYLLARDPRHEASLRGGLRAGFSCRRPEGCPDGVNLWLLEEGDCRRAAKAISCHQDIAADGVFALGMLAEFEPVLRKAGPWFYPRLFWETGLIGQVLYLEAEAAGIRGTGIGCYFDDGMHDLLGLRGREWQSLYHFTVGGAVEDPRLQTIPPYAHLADRGAGGLP